MGMLYDTTRCIGCKACVVACREANDLAARREPRRPPPGPARPQREDEERHQALQGGRQGLLHEVAVHALRGPGLRGGVHAALAAQGRDDGDRRATTRTYCVGCRYCQMACPFNVAKFEFDKAVPKIVKCELCRHRVGDAQARRRRRLQPLHARPRARLLRGLPARGGHLRQARRAPGRGQAAPGREPRRLRAEGLRRDRGRRHAGALPVPRALREARPARLRAAGRAPHRVHDPGGPLQGLRRARGPLRRARGGALEEPQEGRATAGRRCSREQPRPRPLRGRRAHPDPALPAPARDRRPRRRHDALAVRVRPRRGEQPERRLPVGHLDRVRRGHGHRPRLRRLRGRAPRLHPEQGRVPPARPARDPDEPPRLRPRRAGRHRRPRPVLGAVEGAGLLLALEPLAAARGGAVRRHLRLRAARRAVAGLLREVAEEPRHGPAVLRGEGPRARDEVLRVHPRPRASCCRPCTSPRSAR